MQYRIREQLNEFTIEVLTKEKHGLFNNRVEERWVNVDIRGEKPFYIQALGRLYAPINKSYKSLKKARERIKVFQLPTKYHEAPDDNNL